MINNSTPCFNYISKLSGASIEQVIDPIGASFLGRHAYAFSANEDLVIETTKEICNEIFKSNNIKQDRYSLKSDAFGNLYISYFGKNKDLNVAAGSHSDSVKYGGLFDGLSGVASALYFIEKLVKSNQIPEYNYQVIVFRSEEASPVMSRPCLGSSVSTGLIDEASLANIPYGLPNESSLPLKDHFIKRSSPEAWEAVCRQLQNPILTKDNTLLFLELHPSQSRLLSRENYDLGIVVKGIGGMQNRLIQLKPNQIKTINLLNSRRLKIEIIGRADHTGSAFHNLPDNFDITDPERVDALIETANLIDKLESLSKLEETDIAVEYIRPKEFTGYTTVPSAVEIALLINEQEVDIVSKFLDNYVNRFKSQKIKINHVLADDLETNQEAVCLKFSKAFLQLATIVESVASDLALKDQNNLLVGISSGCFGGLVRGTLTDFSIAKSELQFKINLRKADLKIGELLEDQVWSAVKQHISEQLNIDLEQYSLIASSAPPAMIPAEISDELRRIAKAQDYNYNVAEVPSMPAHDAAILGRAGIKIGMIFITDTGGSHVPTEMVSPEHMQAAVSVQHTMLAKALKIDLN